jgi:hypothetical protein
MLCLSAGALSASLAVLEFTLAWTHSVEHLRWEEDWRIEGGLLHADAARVRGSGAGMDIPAGARKIDGVWHYRPSLSPQPRLRLAHSRHAASYELCTPGQACQPLAAYLPGLPDSPTPSGRPDDDTILLTPCP